jgi:hypothetical protein
MLFHPLIVLNVGWSPSDSNFKQRLSISKTIQVIKNYRVHFIGFNSCHLIDLDTNQQINHVSRKILASKGELARICTGLNKLQFKKYSLPIGNELFAKKIYGEK